MDPVCSRRVAALLTLMNSSCLIHEDGCPFLAPQRLFVIHALSFRTSGSDLATGDVCSKIINTQLLSFKQIRFVYLSEVSSGYEAAKKEIRLDKCYRKMG